MKLLIITQAIDKADPGLGFFHNWVMEFAGRFEETRVICLKKGVHELPPGIKVSSLGKERGVGRIGYIKNFYASIFRDWDNYDAVFVHMNQEYVLFGGIFWLLGGKKVYMWRNHHKGSFLTDLAAAFCSKVFCTSKYSYTAKYKRTVLMPVGIDTEIFNRDSSIVKKPSSVLFLGRISPVKKPDLLIEAMCRLKKLGIVCTLSIYGDSLERDRDYHSRLKEKVQAEKIENEVTFYNGEPNEETPRIYNEHEIFVNLSSSGMYDKTIFEAMACGALALCSNENLRGQIDSRYLFTEDNVDELVSKIQALLALNEEIKKSEGVVLRDFVIRHHSLSLLGQKLAQEINLEKII